MSSWEGGHSAAASSVGAAWTAGRPGWKDAPTLRPSPGGNPPCRYAQLDEAAFRRFEAGFSSHPAWLALQQRGRAEAAHLARLLDELQAAAAGGQQAGRR